MVVVFGAYGMWSGHVNSAVTVLQLASQGLKYFSHVGSTCFFFLKKLCQLWRIIETAGKMCKV
jgi:hypothetical protein